MTNWATCCSRSCSSRASPRSADCSISTPSPPSIADKLERRHPHVFADAKIEDSAAQSRAWEQHKRAERAARGQGAGALDGVTLGLPALTRATKLGSRAAKVGFDWADAAGVIAKVREELGELQDEIDKGDRTRTHEELGDLLFALSQAARHLGRRCRSCVARRERQVRTAFPTGRGAPRRRGPNAGRRRHGAARSALGPCQAGTRLSRRDCT